MRWSCCYALFLLLFAASGGFGLQLPKNSRVQLKKTTTTAADLAGEDNNHNHGIDDGDGEGGDGSHKAKLRATTQVRPPQQAAKTQRRTALKRQSVFRRSTGRFNHNDIFRGNSIGFFPAANDDKMASRHDDDPVGRVDEDSLVDSRPSSAPAIHNDDDEAAAADEGGGGGAAAADGSTVRKASTDPGSASGSKEGSSEVVADSGRGSGGRPDLDHGGDSAGGGGGTGETGGAPPPLPNQGARLTTPTPSAGSGSRGSGGRRGQGPRQQHNHSAAYLNLFGGSDALAGAVFETAPMGSMMLWYKHRLGWTSSLFVEKPPPDIPFHQRGPLYVPPDGEIFANYAPVPEVQTSYYFYFTCAPVVTLRVLLFDGYAFERVYTFNATATTREWANSKQVSEVQSFSRADGSLHHLHLMVKQHYRRLVLVRGICATEPKTTIYFRVPKVENDDMLGGAFGFNA